MVLRVRMLRTEVQDLKKCCGHRVLSLFLDRHYSCLDRKYCLLVPYYCLLDGNNSGIVVKAKAAGVKEVFTVLSGLEVFKVGSELLSCMP